MCEMPETKCWYEYQTYPPVASRSTTKPSTDQRRMRIPRLERRLVVKSATLQNRWQGCDIGVEASALQIIERPLSVSLNEGVAA
jgi:hypothetical protein